MNFFVSLSDGDYSILKKLAKQHHTSPSEVARVLVLRELGFKEEIFQARKYEFKEATQIRVMVAIDDKKVLKVITKKANSTLMGIAKFVSKTLLDALSSQKSSYTND